MSNDNCPWKDQQCAVDRPLALFQFRETLSDALPCDLSCFAFSRIRCAGEEHFDLAQFVDEALFFVGDFRAHELNAAIPAAVTGPRENKPRIESGKSVQSEAYSVLQDPDTQQVCEAQRLDRIDNGSGDILGAQA